MSKEWEVKDNLKQAYKDMYQIEPSVEKKKVKRGAYQIRLKYKGEEVVIGEVMKRGLTKHATMEHDGKVEQFKRYYEAEQRANEILRSKDGDII